MRQFVIPLLLLTLPTMTVAAVNERDQRPAAEPRLWHYAAADSAAEDDPPLTDQRSVEGLLAAMKPGDVAIMFPSASRETFTYGTDAEVGQIPVVFCARDATVSQVRNVINGVLGHLVQYRLRFYPRRDTNEKRLDVSVDGRLDDVVKVLRTIGEVEIGPPHPKAARMEAALARPPLQ